MKSYLTKQDNRFLHFNVPLLDFKIQLCEWLKRFFHIRSTWSATRKGDTESTSKSTSSHITNIISSNHSPTDRKIVDILWKLDWSSADPFKSFKIHSRSIQIIRPLTRKLRTFCGNWIGAQQIHFPTKISKSIWIRWVLHGKIITYVLIIHHI